MGKSTTKTIANRLVFKWENDEISESIGHYRCNLYEVIRGKEKKIDVIDFTDYTNEWQRDNAQENRYDRACAFRVSWCCGWSMHKNFGYDEKYNSRVDEKGNRIYGYHGDCTLTVDDVKRWCEEWLAQRYIRSYEDTVKTLNEKKRRAESLETQGYGKMNLEETKWK